MDNSKRRLKELAAVKRTAVQRIQVDIGEIDASPSHKYIADFVADFTGVQGICTLKDIVREASTSDVIWLGDYHALDRCQIFAAEFLQTLHKQRRNIALAVEPVFARHQEHLNRWMARETSDDQFLEAIRYDDDWGCDWASYRLVLDAARRLNIPVYGVDCHPRYDMRLIGRRDLGTARCIARILKEDPARALVVFFGESHLASNHLPKRLCRILAADRPGLKQTWILQNLDEVYWELQSRGPADVSAVQLRPHQYCVFNATPIEKYESFRQYLHKCIHQDVSGDCTEFVHTLIDTMMEFVDLKPHEDFADDLPKVYSEISTDRLPQFLARQSVRPGQVRMTLNSLIERGTSYVPELNSIFVDRLHLSAAAEESARFIHAAFRGELQRVHTRLHEDQFFMTAIERAVGYFFSKVLDPSRDNIESLSERVLDQIGYNVELARAVASLLNPALRVSSQHFETLRTAIQSCGRSAKTSQMLGQLVGYALGRRLYGAFLHSRISRKEIQALLRDPLIEPNRPLQCYRDLTDKLVFCSGGL